MQNLRFKWQFGAWMDGVRNKDSGGLTLTGSPEPSPVLCHPSARPQLLLSSKDS